MKQLKKIEGDQLANATRHEVLGELLPEAPQAVATVTVKGLIDMLHFCDFRQFEAEVITF